MKKLYLFLTILTLLFYQNTVCIAEEYNQQAWAQEEADSSTSDDGYVRRITYDSTRYGYVEPEPQSTAQPITLEELEGIIDVPMLDIDIVGSIYFDSSLYVLTENDALYKIDTDGSVEKFDDTEGAEDRTLCNLFEYENRMWTVISDDATRENNVICCGRICIDADAFLIDETMEFNVNTPITFEGVEREGKLEWHPRYPFMLDGGLYYVDDVTDAGVTAPALIYVKEEDELAELAIGLPGLIDCAHYTNKKIVTVHLSLYSFGVSTDDDKIMDSNPLWLQNVANRTPDCLILMTKPEDGDEQSQRDVTSIAYDKDLEVLYYTRGGKLHCIERMDYNTDRIVADAPADLLVTQRFCDVPSFVTDDGYFMHVVDGIGVDIIPLK